ncbi:MAG TPA: PEGA domain-containing protein, partial [Myxococcales bacterium]
LASSLEVTSRPPDATVFVDGERVGSTPLSGQILPGERKIRLELGGYKTVESTHSVPVRGQVAVQRDLEKMPSRLILSTSPAGADISVDGKSVGKDRVDQGIMPGRHTIRFAAPGYVPYEVVADIKPNETYSQSKALAPTGWQSTKLSMEVAQEDIYKRSLSFVVAFETQTLTTSNLDVQARSSGSTARAQKLLTPSPGSARLIGASAELSAHGRYFGLMIVGAAYLRSTDPWQFQVSNPGTLPATVTTDVDLLSVRLLQPQLRLAIWHFTLSLQGGAELRAFRMQDHASPQMYTDGFLSIDTQLVGQAALRAFLVEGLFLEAAFRYHYTIVNIYGGKGPSTLGLRGGIGYAF